MKGSGGRDAAAFGAIHRLNLKKKYGMIKDRTDKDTRITEVFRYNGTVQAGIY